MKEFRLEDDTGRETLAMFRPSTTIRERHPGEVVHFHDDSYDPEDGRPFTLLCGHCGAVIYQPDIGAPLVWMNRKTSWKTHQSRCEVAAVALKEAAE